MGGGGQRELGKVPLPFHLSWGRGGPRVPVAPRVKRNHQPGPSLAFPGPNLAFIFPQSGEGSGSSQFLETQNQTSGVGVGAWNCIWKGNL